MRKIALCVLAAATIGLATGAKANDAVQAKDSTTGVTVEEITINGSGPRLDGVALTGTVTRKGFNALLIDSPQGKMRANIALDNDWKKFSLFNFADRIPAGDQVTVFGRLSADGQMMNTAAILDQATGRVYLTDMGYSLAQDSASPDRVLRFKTL